MSSRGQLRPLPGGRFALQPGRDWMRAAIAQAALVWLAPWPMLVIALVAPARLRHRCERAWARLAARAVRLKIELHVPAGVQGGAPYLVLPLHEGLADPVALLHLGLPVRFVGLDEFSHWPIAGPYLRASRQLLVRRGDRRQARQLAVGAKAAVRRGESVVVFPQGSILGLEVGFRRGALRLAQRLRVPVLPVVIAGSHRVWEHPFSPRLRFDQRVLLDVLPPVGVAHLSRSELTRLMLALEREMKARALASGRARRYRPELDGTWDDYDFVLDPSFPELAQQLPQRVRRPLLDPERAVRSPRSRSAPRSGWDS